MAFEKYCKAEEKGINERWEAYQKATKNRKRFIL
jgi:hypothetical protein